ncbi:MAG: ribonuclease E/G [Pseudomonadota bacterium]
MILTPGAPGINASRKLADEGERVRLTGVVSEALAARLAEQPVETELGAIIRTSATGVEDARVVGEVKRLFATYWGVFMAANEPRAGWISKSGCFGSDIEAEWLSNPPDALICEPNTADLARSGVSDGDPFNLWSDPIFAGRVEADPAPLDSFGVLECLAALKSPDVSLPEGSLVIEPTRALVAVDVNTGTDFSPAAGLKANLAAARALSRQLRLRGLGGQIVVDFAPMPKKDRRTLEEALRRAFRADLVETSLVGWTPLGHYELQRKRERRPLHEVL